MKRALLLLALVACDRKQSADPPAARPTLVDPKSDAAPAAAAAAAPAPVGDAACKLSDVPLRYAAPAGRVVAIGDLHGDLAATRSALKAAGAIDAKDAWVGGNLTLVQTGDILDRGEDEQAIVDLLVKLKAEAKAAGGAVILLNGNHELMNAAGDLRYVTEGAMHDFDEAAAADTAKWARVPEQARGRIAALAPGGVYAKKFAAHNVVAIVGDTVYSHAGVIGPWATQVEAVNATARCWLDGQAGEITEPPPVLTADDSPVWTRAYGFEDVDCAALASALKALGATRMVVGHTPQQTGITSACDGAVWRIDVGLAKHYQGPIEVLEVAPTPKVLKGSR